MEFAWQSSGWQWAEAGGLWRLGEVALARVPGGRRSFDNGWVQRRFIRGGSVGQWEGVRAVKGGPDVEGGGRLEGEW